MEEGSALYSAAPCFDMCKVYKRKGNDNMLSTDNIILLGDNMLSADNILSADKMMLAIG
jgi:hypothetical protein